MWVRHAPAALSVAMALIAVGAPDAVGMSSRIDSPEVRLSVTATIEDGEPVGAAESFPADVGEVYAVLEVENAPGTTPWVPRERVPVGSARPGRPGPPVGGHGDPPSRQG